MLRTRRVTLRIPEVNVMSESISTAESATHHETKRENFEREAIPHLDLLYRY